MAINHNKGLLGPLNDEPLDFKYFKGKERVLEIDVGKHKISLFSHLARLTDLLSHI